MQRLAEPGHVIVPRDFYSGNTSIRAEVLREIGGFDERFGVYGNEDVELGIRLREAGVQIAFSPSAVAHQDYLKSLPSLARDTAAKGSSAVLLAQIHPRYFSLLRLASPREGSRPWLSLRSLLLLLTRHAPQAAEVIFQLAYLVETAGLWRASWFYRVVLEYAFWAGVSQALDESDVGELAELTRELQRGPLDLLLH
jgi:cellulose synthase/poly-beta-1,6-N-acetylglucosamine synthase-like glycosyltransferase